MASNNTSSLAENFLSYFNVELATTPEEKQRVYEIRYRVYCQEFNYEPSDRFPDNAEYDEYDDISLHCLIMHKSSGQPAGCVRLVPASVMDNSDLLPFEKYCAESVDKDFFAGLNISRSTLCEISRLAVDTAFRRRTSEVKTRFGDPEGMNFSQNERRTFALISIAGFLASTALTDLTGRTNVVAMMEPFLPKLLKRSGIVFERAGRDIDYHGNRAPYFIRTQSALDGMNDGLRELYDEIYTSIKSRFDCNGLVN